MFTLNGIDAKNLVLVGDSAGGLNVVTMMRKARDAGNPLPAAAMAISTWADLTHSGLSAITREWIDPLCNVGFLNILADLLPVAKLRLLLITSAFSS